MRSGEIYALKWKNLNLDEGYIYVEESIKDIVVFNPDKTKSTQLVTTDGKTQNSIRNIYLPDVLINKLKELPKGKDNGSDACHKWYSNPSYIPLHFHLLPNFC